MVMMIIRSNIYIKGKGKKRRINRVLSNKRRGGRSLFADGRSDSLVRESGVPSLLKNSTQEISVTFPRVYEEPRVKNLVTILGARKESCWKIPKIFPRAILVFFYLFQPGPEQKLPKTLQATSFGRFDPISVGFDQNQWFRLVFFVNFDRNQLKLSFWGVVMQYGIWHDNWFSPSYLK